ncbi:hypothetical protein EDC04DRAFT_2901678 [Pisolithus marmoratus]|nr:hypothetical protein EDC04DRAFT_2901678 [Pisolithus marmoratus]
MDAEQCELGYQYFRLTTATARKAFVKEWATRYTQLSCLPYFNLVEQIVIDLMHNLFLGLVKMHFYNIWMQVLYLDDTTLTNAFFKFEIPTSCGKLPTDIGIPAGGSLTADQWLLLTTVYGPIATPQLWSTCLAKAQQDGSLTDHVSLIAKQELEKTSSEEKKKADTQALKVARSRGKDALAAEKAHITVEKVAAEEAKKTEKLRAAEEKKAKKARDAELKWLAKSKGNPTCILADSTILNGLDGFIADILDEAVGKQDETDGKCILHPNDPSNFLKLCAAICLLIKNTVTDQEVSSVDTLLREYCMELIQLYGSGCLKPNHHYATHVSQYIRNFSPLSGFWTFLFERLNKILKSFKMNNHGDGELETTFFNEFHWMCWSGRLVYALQQMPDGSLGCKVSGIMLKASAEERGTIAGLAALSNDLNEAHGEGSSANTMSRTTSS